LDIVESADITWTYTAPTPLVGWGGGTVWNTNGNVTTAMTNTSAGVSIYVRVIVTHNNYEGLADRLITLAVDGQNSVPRWDIVNNTPLDPGPLCTQILVADQADLALQTIKKRPTLTDLTPNPFIPGNQKN
jgi:hypothetical protein